MKARPTSRASSGAPTTTFCSGARILPAPSTDRACRVCATGTRYGCAPAVRSAASFSTRSPSAASTRAPGGPPGRVEPVEEADERVVRAVVAGDRLGVADADAQQQALFVA